MLDAERILNNALAARALTGLDRTEFERLRPPWTKHWNGPGA